MLHMTIMDIIKFCCLSDKTLTLSITQLPKLSLGSNKGRFVKRETNQKP